MKQYCINKNSAQCSLLIDSYNIIAHFAAFFINSVVL